jgi:hypothetical protein
VEMIVLILALAMVVPSPIDEIVGSYVRLAMVLVGFVLIIRWIIINDQKKNRSSHR